MATQIFFFSGKLRKSFLKSREVEHRIVAESARSTRCLQDFSVNTIRDDRHGSSAFRQSDRANEIRHTLGSCFVSHLAQQFFNPLRICRLRPSVSRGMNAWRAAESRHDEPRVVGEDQSVLKPRVMQRLAGRIFGECWSVFLERGKRMKI